MGCATLSYGLCNLHSFQFLSPPILQVQLFSRKPPRNPSKIFATVSSAQQRTGTTPKRDPSGENHCSVPQTEKNIEMEPSNVGSKQRLKQYSSFYACQALDEMPEQDVVSWTALIQGFVAQRNGRQGVDLFCEMRKKGISPNEFTVATSLKACSMCWDISFGKQVHAEVIKEGLLSDVFIASALVNLYAKCGEINLADKVLFCMPEQNEVLWNVLINCHAQVGDGKGAFRLFFKMINSEVEFSEFTLSSVLKGCTDSGQSRDGQLVHCLAIKSDHDVVSWSAMIACLEKQDVSVSNALIGMHIKNGCVDDGYWVFETMTWPDLVSWNTLLSGFQDYAYSDQDQMFSARCLSKDLGQILMITGFAQTEKEEKAIKFLNSMQQEGVRPNEFTIAGCLGGCSRITASESGRQLHSMALKSGLLPDMFVSGALVDMYAKCGCIEDAETILKELVRHDKVLWNTIRGFSLHGQGDKALETFQKMKDEGNLPDDVTFIGVLFACSHMDLVEEGKQHFNSLSNVYGVTPRDEHYVCMVDILSHAGRFADVESFVEAMKLTSNALVWENVLGACAKHRNVKFGERAAKKAI
ncbi:Pentatricopeptide repeat-containing protein [Arachis hypogaea]|nr:Pentatricopeptide repeat-containing protein [Arachis hypogaea]